MLPNLVGMVAFWGVGIHFLVEDITGSLTGHLKFFNKLSPPMLLHVFWLRQSQSRRFPRSSLPAAVRLKWRLWLNVVVRWMTQSIYPISLTWHGLARQHCLR